MLAWRSAVLCNRRIIWRIIVNRNVILPYVGDLRCNGLWRLAVADVGGRHFVSGAVPGNGSHAIVYLSKLDRYFPLSGRYGRGGY
jgi:hypothetical protein